jgi:hypothetical protein
MTPGPLDQLRDWHLPEPPSWWPPAPGWWVVALLVVVALVWAMLAIRRRIQRGAAARSALDELDALQTRLVADGDARAFTAGVSGLLRRLALERFPREQVAGLTGEAWLSFLDATGGQGRFRDGPGRALAAAYGMSRPEDGGVDVAALTGAAAAWIRAHRRPARRAPRPVVSARQGVGRA